MPFRTRLIINGNPYRDEIDVINALPSLMLEGARQTKEVVEPHWLDEARYYPPPAVLPFQFATEKSKRYYFARLKKRGLNIGRYVRTKQLQQSFFMRLLQSQRGIEFIFGTDSDKAKWVIGSFDQNRNYQVPGHRNTGWPLIALTALFWLGTAEEDFLERMGTLYAEFDVRRQNR